jgi:hypothetical protein
VNCLVGGVPVGAGDSSITHGEEDNAPTRVTPEAAIRTAGDLPGSSRVLHEMLAKCASRAQRRTSPNGLP